jgi:hypothetical protein
MHGQKTLSLTILLFSYVAMTDLKNLFSYLETLVHKSQALGHVGDYIFYGGT